MTDIVKRLCSCHGIESGDPDCNCTEAADEIERLRKRAQSRLVLYAELRKQDIEIERLRGEFKRLLMHYNFRSELYTNDADVGRHRPRGAGEQMTDIVERLRDHDIMGHPLLQAERIMQEAADEIERLHAAEDQLAKARLKIGDQADRIDQLEAELSRLREKFR
jgi:DNA repair exonuclease SbcCD ATPase subunit